MTVYIFFMRDNEKIRRKCVFYRYLEKMSILKNFVKKRLVKAKLQVYNIKTEMPRTIRIGEEADVFFTVTFVTLTFKIIFFP